jgi:cobalt ECF transporter T component CbiQ/cobalamin biosynthesis protein CbiM
MHIPDGYLSPETCGVFAAGMVPVFARAGKRVRRVVKSRYVPLLAIGAAYSFLIMMLNVPIPDGTTAHAVGAVLIAVILGPDAAVIAVSTALAIQALFFGDGGVLAYGANTFNMAFVMPMVGYYLVYRPLARHASLTSPRRAVAAALGGYVGLSASALCAAIELGVQPGLFHSASGAPLYAPYHLAQTIPAMMLAHLTVAGGVEFALTLGVVFYLQKANLPILRINHSGVADHDRPADADAETPAGAGAGATGLRWRHALFAVGALALLSPLGLIYNSGAFGEAVPKGLNRYSGFWHHTLLPGYDFRHDQHPALGYILSAVVGAAAVAAVLLALFGVVRLVPRLVARFARQGQPDSAAPRAAGAPSAPAGPGPATALTTAPARTSRTPQWLIQSEVGLCPCGCIGTRAKGSFVQKTLAGGATVMRQAMFGEDIASGPGLLQQIDPRVKLITLLGMLVGAALVRNIAVLVGLYALTLALAAASHLKLGFFIKRVWLFIPIFTGIVVAPATLNLVTHGPIVVPLGHWWFGRAVGVTSTGLRAAGLIVTRVAVSISIVVLLTLTTPWAKLMAALRALRVPRIFIQIMGMAYRYLFYLLGSVDDMYTARRSRMVGTETNVASGRAFVSATAGALFGKAHALSEEVYLAMVSRGYTGDALSIDSFQVRTREAVWGAACLLTLTATLGIDRALGR